MHCFISSMMNEHAPYILTDSKSLEEALNQRLSDKGRIFILADSNTSEHCLPMIQSMLPQDGKDCMLMDLAAGEDAKSLDTAMDLYRQLITYGADRSSVMINLGGGMVCDLGGFVASTYKRGMEFIHVPTTVLAQVDAAIGGKTGVNLGSLKNMVGNFTLPSATLIYPEFLNTLPKREVMAGFAEILKHALIADHSLWTKIIEAPYIDLPLIKSIIPEASHVKVGIVNRDFEEKGERKKLNFGHTIGHALESLILESPGKNLLHGEAVALGMIAESYLSMKAGKLSDDELKAISDFIAQHYKPIELDRMQFHRIIELMRHDKKNKRSKVNFTLLNGIGDSLIDQEPDMEDVMEALNYLEHYPFPA
jgi:3-dehydroquinate synthase